jgi:hypothetical protein
MASTWRTVRVFISSTFRDMHAERQVLESVVFPEVCRRSKSLQVEVIKVDPCYGVSEEEAEGVVALGRRLEPDEEPERPAKPRGLARRAPGRQVERQATVRYYSRMNPDRVYPLLVAITREAVQQPKGQAFDQQGRSFAVAPNAVVDVEPMLPGCDCYPPRQQARVGKDAVKLTFYVVPKVLGEVTAARVVVRHTNRILAEIP